MMTVQVDERTRIGLLNPSGAMTASDFEIMRDVIDAYIEEEGLPKGLIIHTKKFPGWESFCNLLPHFRFADNYHERIPRVALVSDTDLRSFAEKLSEHLRQTEVKSFAFDEFEDAEAWLSEAEPTSAPTH